MINKMRRSIEQKINKDQVHSDKAAYELLKRIRQINLADISIDVLRKLSMDLICKVISNKDPHDSLIEAFALVNEVVVRVLKIKTFDCQLIAGIHLYNNKMIEMQTGEGKTLAAVFPSYLNALSGKGVHILTFNDYLAKRDAEWMGPVYKSLGLSVGYINEGMNSQQRKAAYACDITYVTAKEAGFDYLRDSLCYDASLMVHRPFHYAIVDEADSILIDEARIPLVIAAGTQVQETMFSRIFKLIQELQKGAHYDTDEFMRNVYLTEKGIRLFETALECGNLYDNNNLHLLSEINSALHAEVLLQRDVDYIVKEGRIELVDDFTGRVVENRHWPDRLQTAVEVKEGINVASKGRVMSSISIRSFIRLYPGLSGMTGTAVSSRGELMDFYGIETKSIEPNKPCIRIDHPDLICFNQTEKFRAILEEIIKVNKTGRPILIGTCNIVESEKLEFMLKDNNISCRVLNAKNNSVEAQIVADAGALGAVTVSTNMAGRGTDIKLGGVDEKDRDKVVELGGLYVIGTNRHESIRIDNQLRGRAGRQGDPGSSRFFISLDDNIFTKYNVENKLIKKFVKSQETAVIKEIRVQKAILQIQRTIEGQNYEIRKTLLKYSNIIEVQRKIIFETRADFLTGKKELNILKSGEPELYDIIADKIGTEKMQELERTLILYTIDECWSDYLEHISYIRDGIHLVIIGGKNPLEEYLSDVTNAFEELQQNIKNEIINSFKSIKVLENGIDFDMKQLKGPSATWTYLVNDNPFEDDLGLMLASNRNVGFSAVAAGLPFISINLIIGLIYQRFIKKGRQID